MPAKKGKKKNRNRDIDLIESVQDHLTKIRQLQEEHDRAIGENPGDDQPHELPEQARKPKQKMRDVKRQKVENENLNDSAKGNNSAASAKGSNSAASAKGSNSGASAKGSNSGASAKGNNSAASAKGNNSAASAKGSNSAASAKGSNSGAKDLISQVDSGRGVGKGGSSAVAIEIDSDSDDDVVEVKREQFTPYDYSEGVKKLMAGRGTWTVVVLIAFGHIVYNQKYDTS